MAERGIVSVPKAPDPVDQAKGEPVARKAAKAPRFQFEGKDENGILQMRPIGPMEEARADMAATFGTSTDAMDLLTARLFGLFIDPQSPELTRADKVSLNQGLALQHDIAPADPLEGMLASQMIAVHMATMDAAARAAHSKGEARDNALGHMVRLSRTYAAQLEALNRHRGKGQQKVTVEHVHVYEGGQAVVGMVEPGRAGGGNGK